jgi:serine/threonine protein kinase
MQQLYKRVTEGKVQSLPGFYSRDLDLVVKLCLQVNPDKRPTCSELLQNKSLLKHRP